jgi:outer membrane receptor protein involved in Fe transport
LASLGLASLKVAVAQTESATKSNQLTLQEIVVSATRRGDVVLQSVPAAISVVSPSDLDNKGMRSLQDLSELLPSGVVYRTVLNDTLWSV